MVYNLLLVYLCMCMVVIVYVFFVFLFSVREEGMPTDLRLIHKSNQTKSHSKCLFVIPNFTHKC